MRPKPWPPVRPSGCRRLECDFDWGKRAGRTSFIDVAKEELVDAFFIAPGVAGALRGRSQGQKLVSTWQSRNAVLSQKVTHLPTH